MPKLLLPAILVALVLTACGGGTTPSPSVTPSGAVAPVTLAGTVWRATSVAGQPTVVGHEPTATFTATEVNGTTGCNAYGAAYTYSDGTIKVGPMRLTMMACSGAIGEVESRFTQAMAGATTATTTDSVHLVLDGSAGSIEFVAIIT